MATLGGLETARVGVEEIGTLFLTTGTTLNFPFTAVISLGIVGFKAGGTDVTTVEEPGETGDDFVMGFLVQQDQLFGKGPFLTFDVVRAVCIDHDYLVVVEGWSFTELGQLFVPTRTKWYVGFVME